MVLLREKNIHQKLFFEMIVLVRGNSTLRYKLQSDSIVNMSILMHNTATSQQ